MVSRLYPRKKKTKKPDRLNRDRLDEDRLAAIDDRLADLARQSANGVLSAESHAALVRHIEARDRLLETVADWSRSRQRRRIEISRGVIRAHAMALCSLRRTGDAQPHVEELRRLRSKMLGELGSLDLGTRTDSRSSAGVTLRDGSGDRRSCPATD